MRAGPPSGSAAAVTVISPQPHGGGGQGEIRRQALAQGEEDGVPPSRQEAQRADLDPVRPAHRQVLDEIPAPRGGRGLPALAVGAVGDFDDGLLQRRTVPVEHAAIDGGTGRALGRERGGGKAAPERNSPGLPPPEGARPRAGAAGEILTGEDGVGHLVSWA